MTPEQKQNRLRFTREWRQRNKAKVAKTKAAWYEKNKERDKLHKRNSGLRIRHGITVEEQLKLIATQGGKCLGCFTELLNLPIKQVHVDHDHATGRIRGILCHHCNLALGLLKDSKTTMLNLISYLERGGEA